jgi:predicted DsbA family dithiol-disulfide isomerase
MSLDMAKWKTALDAGTHRAAVEADAKVGDDANIHGTPSFLINGYFISGAQPYPRFRRLIERALADTARR